MFCSFSGRFDLRFVWKLDQNVPEYHGFESPEARLCGSSGNLEIAYKPVSRKLLEATRKLLEATRKLLEATRGY